MVIHKISRWSHQWHFRSSASFVTCSRPSPWPSHCGNRTADQPSMRRPVTGETFAPQVPKSSCICVYHMGLEAPRPYIQVPEGKNLKLDSFTGYKHLLWSCNPLEGDMATHFHILTGEESMNRIPWTEEPGRPQSTGSQRDGHSRVTKRSTVRRCC